MHLLLGVIFLCLFFFFFSSRRRHTRSLCDWSSDVCSSDLHKFISQPSETWYGAFNVSQPVFQGGALRSQLRFARANWQEAVLSYQQTVQNALEQVSNSLVASQKDREFREQQELLTQAAQQTDQLSEVLYKNGGASDRQ